MDLQRLKEPFPGDHVHWRIGSSGQGGNGVWAQVLAYITNRDVMERLDEVVGPGNWWNEYKVTEHGVLCGITIRTPEGPVTKWDGADATDVEATKGGFSDSMKRAAVQWGIGRYLYNLGNAWANIHDRGKYRNKLKDGNWHKWDPPPLPDWALPPKGQPQAPAAQPKPTPKPAATPLPKINWKEVDKPTVESMQASIAGESPSDLIAKGARIGNDDLLTEDTQRAILEKVVVALVAHAQMHDSSLESIAAIGKAVKSSELPSPYKEVAAERLANAWKVKRESTPPS